MVSVEAVRFEGGALGALATATPSLQWELSGDEKNWKQKSYEIQATFDDGSTKSASKETEESIHVLWPFRALRSREKISVKVRVFGQDGSESAWSKEYSMRVGVLNNEWSALFIAQKDQKIATHEEKISPEILFRSPPFTVAKKVKSATIYSTAMGVYELEINGSIVSSAVLAPGWTSYQHRLLHQVYDVTSLLATDNVIGARVAAGWYSGFFGFDGGASNIYGTQKAISLELCIAYEDGSTDVISTSEDWKATDQGPITNAQLYNGEDYDANKEIAGWSSPGIDDSVWSAVETISNPSKRSVPQSFGYSRVVDVLKPQEIITTQEGKKVLDFGQNAVGVVHMKPVKASKGHVVTFIHAEVMENGELGVRPLREAQCTDRYTFNGSENGDEYTPRFTFHGCRYVQVDSYPGELTTDSISFNVISTEMDQVGTFDCSDPMLNRLHQNVFHSTRGNFLSIPMDCPQRDERMGWLGDIAVFAPTGLYLFDSYSFLKSWLEDLRYDQDANGGYPSVVVPDVIRAYETLWNGCYAAIWQDASVIVPWRLYEFTKNTDVLISQYDSMKTWYEFLPKPAGHIRWDKVKMQLGDWLDPTAPPENPLLAMTDAYLVADAFLYLILTQLVETSKTLGKQDDYTYFKDSAAKCKKDYHDAYVSMEGSLKSDTQTAYALTICFGLYDNNEQLKYAGQRLADLCKSNNYKIGTGFAGTPFVTEALALTGHLDDAYKMLLTKECPSWLYPVTMGATTIWERWDSMMPDGSINPGSMTSFNHYALGAVAMWMHERIGGLKMESPAYAHFLLKPLPGGGLTFAETKHRSPYGWIESKWVTEAGKTTYTVKVPLNTTADVELPNGEKHSVGSGVYNYEF